MTLDADELDPDGLRTKALERLQQRHPHASGMSSGDLQSLIHELEIRQVELEVQNEELHRVQIELVETRNRYFDLYAHAPVGYLTLNANMVVVEANLAAIKLCGSAREHLVGKRLERLVAPKSRDKCFLFTRRAALEKTSGSFQLAGSECWVSMELTKLDSPLMEPNEYRLILMDITERLRAEKAAQDDALKQKNAELDKLVRSLQDEIDQRRHAEAQLDIRATQLRALAGELALAEHRERRRIAGLLHDHLQQQLVAAKYRAENLRKVNEPVVQSVAEELEKLLNECIVASRTLTAELCPAALHTGGLGPGLQWLARWMDVNHGLHVQLTTQENPNLPEDVLLMVFGSIRELLFNTVKHAQVKEASVALQPMPGQGIQITVKDEGCGFDPNQVKPSNGLNGGLGLFSIRERLSLIGGQMQIKSESGKGSCFIITVPVTQQPEAIGWTAKKIAIERTPPLEGRKHEPAGNKIRILLSDDHAVVREGLAELLGNEPDMEVVGQAENGEMAVDLARRIRPDVVLMDLNMPKMDGVEATQAILAEQPEISVIGLSMFDEPERTRAMRNAGARDYLLKSGPSACIIASVRACTKHAYSST